MLPIYSDTDTINGLGVRDDSQTLGAYGDVSAPADSGTNAVPEIYNTDILFCKGFKPTYIPLKDYGFMFQSANMKNQLNGYGFDFTIDQLKNTVKNHWRDCAIIAKHLKADTLEQSCFNIWHWLHKNIKYNYDAPGKEQIRTPRRVWADRFKGVDCDCLAVFTYCTLACMGYQPKFEIVAFKNRDQYSHIYIVCGNVVVDRCLPWFNQRPQHITKTQQVMIPVYELNGVNGLGYADNENEDSIMQGFAGMYHDTLLRIGTHTATPKDYTNFKKAKLMLQLQGEDHYGFLLAGLLLPYVTDIDNNGGMYFDNEHVANVAVVAERQLNALENNPNATEEDLGKLFKKIKKALKKATKAVGKAVKTVAKTTAKATKAVVKNTAKVVKATAKATAKVTKAAVKGAAKVTKAAVKSAAKVTKAAVKSAGNAVKAAANVVKATAQVATGNAKKAAATLKKAGQQVKKAVVQPVKAVAKATKVVTKTVIKNAIKEPIKSAAKQTKAVVKTVAKATKNIVKNAVVNPVKQLVVKPIAKTVKFAGKVFKVIFVKINPVTVLMRQSLRMLISLNFVGMATRLNVGNLTEQQAINAGYTKQQWEDAKKARKRVIKLFTTMGGKAANIEKAIVKGAKKKALFKKNYKPNQKIKTVGEDDATLGDPGTIGAALAAVGGFIAKIWGWIKKIVPKAVKAVATAAKKTTKAVATAAKKTAEVVKKTTKAVATATKKTAEAVKKVAKKTAEVTKKVVDNVKKTKQQTGNNTANPNAKKAATATPTKQVVKQSAGLSTGAKIGIGVGAGALLLLLVMKNNKKKA